MRAMTSLLASFLAILLLAVAGCSKTDNSADRNATTDQATPSAADQDSATEAPGKTTTFEGEPPPPPTEEQPSPDQ